MVFGAIQDRRGRNILSVRDQNNFDLTTRQKRLMTVAHLFLIHRYKIDSVHYVTPTEDNLKQAERMKARGIYGAVSTEIGEIIVADVVKERLKELVVKGSTVLADLIKG